MKKLLSKATVLALTLAMAFSMVACSSSTPATTPDKSGSTEKETITIRIGSGHAETNPWIAALEDYFVPTISERVSAETNYEIEWVKAYGGSIISLGNEIEGIESGLVDIGCSILVFEASRLPLQTMVYSMPFSCSDPQIVADVYSKIITEYPEFTTDYEKYNQRYLGLGVSDQYGFYSTKEVNSLADVSGMKIGAAGINLAWIEGSGAVGVQTSLNDTYQNLQTSVCDATIQPTNSCVNMMVYEVAPYYLDANFNVVPFNSITANLDFWNDLPAEVQDIIAETGESYLEYEADYISEVHAADLKLLEEKGVTISALDTAAQSDWANSLSDVVNGLVKNLNDNGYKGAEIVSRYYELLEENGIERVRDWDIS